MTRMHDESLHDRSREISDYLEGELDERERRELEAHLAECAACADTLGGYRRLSARARALSAVPPDRDLWPSIRARLRSPILDRRVWLAAAAAALITSGAWWLALRGDSNPETEVATGGRFVLLLHETAELGDPAARSADEIARTVDEYRRWAQSLARAGRLESGEKLADAEGFVVHADRTDARGVEVGLGGLFIVRAASYDEALAIAQSCPHLAYGGWIEVRRIEET